MVNHFGDIGVFLAVGVSCGSDSDSTLMIENYRLRFAFGSEEDMEHSRVF